MCQKFVKKNIPVEAYQLTEDAVIHTLEGDMKAKKGDWIIIGVEGERYPVRKDIFEKTYTKVGG